MPSPSLFGATFVPLHLSYLIIASSFLNWCWVTFPWKCIFSAFLMSAGRFYMSDVWEDDCVCVQCKSSLRDHPARQCRICRSSRVQEDSCKSVVCCQVYFTAQHSLLAGLACRDCENMHICCWLIFNGFCKHWPRTNKKKCQRNDSCHSLHYGASFSLFFCIFILLNMYFITLETIIIDYLWRPNL